MSNVVANPSIEKRNNKICGLIKAHNNVATIMYPYRFFILFMAYIKIIILKKMIVSFPKPEVQKLIFGKNRK